MKKQKVIPIILSGGTGTRLWPASRHAYPKQFLRLGNDKSLLQLTVERTLASFPDSEFMVIANERHRFLLQEQLTEYSSNLLKILLEPTARNTAPAILSAVLYLQEAQVCDENTILLLIPSDHMIGDLYALTQAYKYACDYASSSKVVIFGVPPVLPEIGYGYIKAVNRVQDSELVGHYVSEFKEKPALDLAKQYIKSGEYFWNSGILAADVQKLTDTAKQLLPKEYAMCKEAVAQAVLDLGFIRLPEEVYASIPSVSFDEGVLERLDYENDLVMLPLDCEWSDLGSWKTISDNAVKDEVGNTLVGDVLQVHTKNSYIEANSRLVVAIGVDNLIVVELADAILIMDKSKSQDVKKLVEILNQNARCEANEHSQVYRPWGYYQSIISGDRFQVKKIVVNSGAKLSMQMHHHRAEHWVVVKGTARVYCDDEVFTLTENESFYIPVASKHRLENMGKLPLEVIEVQTGSYLGEDDIIRFDDDYGRSYD